MELLWSELPGLRKPLEEMIDERKGVKWIVDLVGNPRRHLSERRHL